MRFLKFYMRALFLEFYARFFRSFVTRTWYYWFKLEI